MSFVGEQRTHLVCFEARLPVNGDLEEACSMVQLDGAEMSAIPICVVALAKSQRVWVRMRLDVDGPVVEETAH